MASNLYELTRTRTLSVFPRRSLAHRRRAGHRHRRREGLEDRKRTAEPSNRSVGSARDGLPRRRRRPGSGYTRRVAGFLDLGKTHAFELQRHSRGRHHGFNPGGEARARADAELVPRRSFDPIMIVRDVVGMF
jgi:hypothetical protein